MTPKNPRKRTQTNNIFFYPVLTKKATALPENGSAVAFFYFFLLFFDRSPPQNLLLPKEKILFSYPKKLLFSQYLLLNPIKSTILQTNTEYIFFTMPKKCPCGMQISVAYLYRDQEVMKMKRADHQADKRISIQS